MELKLSTNEVVASNVRAEMARLGYSSPDLAEVLNVSRYTANRKRTGVIPFTLNELPVVAKWLNTPLAALLTEGSLSAMPGQVA